MALKLVAGKPPTLSSSLRVSDAACAAQNSSIKGDDSCALDKLHERSRLENLDLCVV